MVLSGSQQKTSKLRLDVEVVLAALVTAVGGIITTILLKFRSENTQDHATVMDAIRTIGGKVENIDSKLDGHIDWHLKGASSGQIPSRNKKSASRSK
jgi:hypothetical protein